MTTVEENPPPPAHPDFLKGERSSTASTLELDNIFPSSPSFLEERRKQSRPTHLKSGAKKTSPNRPDPDLNYICAATGVEGPRRGGRGGAAPRWGRGAARLLQ